LEHCVGSAICRNRRSGHNLRAFSVRDCLSYTPTLPINGAALGFTTIGQLEDDVRITQNFKPRSNDEMDAIRVHASMKHREVNFGPHTGVLEVKDQ
jgi:hypothetical protein